MGPRAQLRKLTCLAKTAKPPIPKSIASSISWIASSAATPGTVHHWITILDGINAQQAATRAVPNGHTIWELVLHVTAWKNETRKRLSGAPAGEPAEGDWPEAGDVT